MNNVDIVQDESAEAIARAIHARLPAASSVEFRAQYAGIAFPDTVFSVNAEDIEYEFGVAVAEEVFRGIAAALRQIAGAEFDILTWAVDKDSAWTYADIGMIRYAVCAAGAYPFDNLY